MTGLVLVGDTLVPMDRIERASPMWDGFGKGADPRVRLKGKDLSLSVHGGEFDSFLMRPTQLIPAPAGVYALRLWIEDEGTEAEVLKTAVIAWALCFDGEVRPVTPRGVNDCNPVLSSVHVEMPDGSVCSTNPEDNSYDDVESYRRGEGARKLEQRDARVARAGGAA